MAKNTSGYTKDHTLELGERYKDMIDHRCYTQNLRSCHLSYMIFHIFTCIPSTGILYGSIFPNTLLSGDMCCLQDKN